MNTLTVKAPSIEAALEKVRAEYGSSAMILNIRQRRETGVSRLWKKPFVEVVAAKGGSEGEATAERSEGGLNLVSDEDILPSNEPAMPGQEVGSVPQSWESAISPQAGKVGDLSSVDGLLASLGLMPAFQRQIGDEVELKLSDLQERTPALMLRTIFEVLSGYWREPEAEPLPQQKTIRVLVGPSGSGKSTLLCKWLSRKILLEKQEARLWRLDGDVANASEVASIYAEVLGVSEERFWEAGEVMNDEFSVGFIDMPGVDWKNPEAIKQLGARLKGLGRVEVSLVLNAAYDLPVLMSQARAFAGLPIKDLIFSHLDEISSPTRLWNVLLGTKYPVRFLGGGQNIPGSLDLANAEKMFPYLNR